MEAKRPRGIYQVCCIAFCVSSSLCHICCNLLTASTFTCTAEPMSYAQNWIYPSCQNLVYTFTCNNSNNWWKDVLLNNRWVKSIFSVVYNPPFPADLLHLVINNSEQRKTGSYSLFNSVVMYTLLIVQIRCTHSLVAVMGVNETCMRALSSLTPIKAYARWGKFPVSKTTVLIGYRNHRYRSDYSIHTRTSVVQLQMEAQFFLFF